MGDFFSGAAGGLFGGVAGLLGASQQNAANQDSVNRANSAAWDGARQNFAEQEKSAREQMAFQERMSNSAYQRATADMTAAGINPMLAYAQGGASAPSGASGSGGGSIGGQAAKMENVLGKTVSSAFEAMSLKKELESKDSVIALNRAAEGAKKTESEVNIASAQKAQAEAKRLKSIQPVIDAQNALDLKNIKTDSKYQGIDQGLKRINKVTESLGNAASAFLPKIRIGGERTTINPKTTGTFNKRTGEIRE